MTDEPSALQTPAPDAPASEWGAFAESIPGWADLPGDRSGPHRMPRLGPQSVPDPDHWAWEGWLRRMLGNQQDSIMLITADAGLVHWYDGESWDSPAMPMGRACIAVAAANGRWPGGEG